MKSARHMFLVAMCLSVNVVAQTNSFLKLYAGVYDVLPFGEESPTATSERITLSVDGRWSTTSFSEVDSGTPTKGLVKRQGTWKASEGRIQQFTDKGMIEFAMDGDLFLSANTYLQRVFISAPAFVKKYAASYHVLYEGETAPGPVTATLKLLPSGKATITQPLMDDDGNVTELPRTVSATWQANTGIIRIAAEEEGQQRITEYTLTSGVFLARNSAYLKKVPPPPPPNPYMKLYAGVYRMHTDGHAPSPDLDRYELTPDGKCTWTLYTTILPDGTVSKVPDVKNGKWWAREGLIHLFFDIGSFDMGGENLLSDFRLKDGVFRINNFYLKKEEPVKK